MLKRLYPNKQKPGIDYDPEEIEALEVAKNFAWPLRDWSAFIHTFASTLEHPKPVEKLSSSVERAQNLFHVRVNTTAMKVAHNSIQDDLAKAEIESALARFVNESGLGQAAQDWNKAAESNEAISALAR